MNKLLVLIVMLSSLAQAREQVLLKDIGIIGLASHDMFAWDRENEVNTENGRLDLSTIFDYENGKRWKKGGNSKNAENAPVWSITKRLVRYHKKLLREKMSFEQARILTVKKFHSMIEDSFKRLSGMSFPTSAIDEAVTNTEQAALRAMHDILPGRVKTMRGKLYPIKTFKLTNFWMAKFYLNERELNQEIIYFNGDYDQEYKEIKIPFAGITINLKQVDGEFIERFSPYNHSEMLRELAAVGREELNIEDVSFIHHIKELFQKGICSKDNQWINNQIPCE